jgi:methylthioribose-1-phosphate isomerase
MLVNGQHFRTIWLQEPIPTINIIDQRFLPHKFIIEELHTVKDIVVAIKEMKVRGAGLIGAAAGYGMWLAAIESANSSSFDESLLEAAQQLRSARPTAVNPEWAVDRQLKAIAKGKTFDEKISLAKQTATDIANEDATHCQSIGKHGVGIIEEIAKRKNGDTVNILTHCNAGWLAFVDNGSATAPIYEAANKGIKVHIWVDETRPRNQGASLTAWELLNQDIPHAVIADNTGGHLMQRGMVDLVITGADRVTRGGDAANKIGTYLKALAAFDNHIPFYVALPSSSFDWQITDGVKEIKIEERTSDEVKYIEGLCEGEIKKVLVTPEKSPAANYGFDVTPARLITGLITEWGICKADEQSILQLFPQKQLADEK